MSQPWPDGAEPGNPGGLEMGTVKPEGGECARQWPGAPPGDDYYEPPGAEPDPGEPPFVPVLEVTGVDPDHGSAAGGETVTVYGADFTLDAAVTFGGTAAGGISVTDDNQLDCTTPPGTEGPADVTVTTGSGSAALPGGFTYEAATAPASPVAAFTYLPPAPSTTTNVSFDASTSQPGEGQQISSYDWLFNNQATRNGVSVTWRMPSAHGDYDATLTITDTGGNTDSLTQVITI